LLSKNLFNANFQFNWQQLTFTYLMQILTIFTLLSLSSKNLMQN
jgi:hypothetical protein